AELVTAEVDPVCARWPELNVRASIDDHHAIVEADPIFLARVLSNLLDNAAKAATRTGHRDIEVVVGRHGNGVAVRVVDHGDGLDPIAREQLFYPFYRLEERTSKLGPRLGLAIAPRFLHL